MGIGAIRSIFEYWRPILDLGSNPLTTDMARKTFVTFGIRYAGMGSNRLRVTANKQNFNLLRALIRRSSRSRPSS